MFETELKFQVPPAQRQALHKAVASARAVSTRLQAVYVDTADQRLAAAGLALRLRKEGRVWVQALKGRGDGLLQRLEHEVRLPAKAGAAGGVPALDPRRHAGTAVGDQLLRLLGDAAVLQCVYRTDIRRLHRRVRHGGALVELAYDRGHLVAGEQRAVVDEIEFELIRGPGAALVDLAQRWSQRHGLWWDVRSKSERGLRLALGLDTVPAVNAQASALAVSASPAAAWRSMLADALAQAAPNAAEIGSGSAGSEHLHQLRVGLRRLRAVLRVFAPLSEDPAAALTLEADWRAPFAILGAARDRELIALELQPALAAAGAPPLTLPPPLDVDERPQADDLRRPPFGLQAEWPSPATRERAGARSVRARPPEGGEQSGQATFAQEPGELVRSTAFNALLLRSLALCQQPMATACEAPLSAAAQAELQPLWRRVRRDAAAFASASVEDQHRLRKRLKRLRYALEAVAPLLKRRTSEALLRALRQSALALGELNDLQVAQALYRSHAQAEPQAWFAVGYLAARLPGALEQAALSLARLRKQRLRWR